MLDNINPEHHLWSMIGYHLTWENSLMSMVMVQGKQCEVVNIGLGIKQVAVKPRNVSVPQYVKSLSLWSTSTFFLFSIFGGFVSPPRGCCGSISLACSLSLSHHANTPSSKKHS
jgi:hypothetical protein